MTEDRSRGSEHQEHYSSMYLDNLVLKTVVWRNQFSWMKPVVRPSFKFQSERLNE